MGKVLVKAKVVNLNDLAEFEGGFRKTEDIREQEIPNALVDTGAAFLSLPTSMIARLGLRRFRSRKARTSGGVIEFGMFGAVRLTIDGRDCTVDVAEVPDDCPALVGQIPLEALDFVVDPVGQRLIGNPDHGGEHMMDLYVNS
jgi:predicted aspartyl protease